MTAPPFPHMPSPGMRLAFRPAVSSALADIPDHIVSIWPRFHSGDYLVTLRYAQPVKFRNTLVTHVDALFSELYQPSLD